MRKATEKDKTIVLDIISTTFYDNKIVNYVIKQGKNNIDSIKSQVDYSFKLCVNFGEVWIDEDEIGCLMVLNPHDQKVSLASLRLDLQLAIECIGISRIGKVLGRESEIKHHHPAALEFLTIR